MDCKARKGAGKMEGEMNEFEVVTVIGRPVEEVFAVVREVTKTPIWTPGLSRRRARTSAPGRSTRAWACREW